MKLLSWYDKVFIFAGIALFIIPAVLKILGFGFIKPLFVPCCVVGGVLLGVELFYFAVFITLAYLTTRIKKEE
jgi:hypothetical protein